jgi:cytochrome c oxidase subunit 4
MAAHVTSSRSCYIVFGALLVLLVLTVVAAGIENHTLGIIIALLIATVKALLIIVYFMNVRFADWVTRLAVAAGFVGLIVLLAFMMSDYLTRDPIAEIEPSPVTRAMSEGPEALTLWHSEAVAPGVSVYNKRKNDALAGITFGYAS